jgi:tetrahydromethanopterin S-methyltransferase subunit B
MANIDIKLYENALPDSLKLTGSQKLGQLILDKGFQIGDIIQPQLDKIISNLNTPDGTCLPESQLNLIIEQRNNIVNHLNKIETTINTISKSLGITSTILDTLINTAKTIRTAKNIANAGQSLSPVANGQVTSLIFTLNDVLDTLKFDSLGNSKLNKLQNIIDYAAAPVAITSDFISKAITTLGLIDAIIKKCSPYATLDPISNDLILITEQQIKASQTQNEITYQGFIIEIQEVPFSPTVNRRKAVGKNAQGIPLIETELSFTTNNQTLINELKLIIDRDNLKAY